MPGIAEANIKAQDAVVDAIRKALDELAPQKPRRHAGPARHRGPRLRARLRYPAARSQPKPFPFCASACAKWCPSMSNTPPSATRSWSQGEAAVKVLATIMPGPVLAEYEAAVRAAGYEPGVVLPSSLASLAALDSLEPILAANLSGQALTTSITCGQDLHLFRTVDLPEDPERASPRFSAASPSPPHTTKTSSSAARAACIMPAFENADDFARIVGDPELAVVDMVPNTGLGATTALGPLSIAGISGALAGA